MEAFFKNKGEMSVKEVVIAYIVNNESASWCVECCSSQCCTFYKISVIRKDSFTTAFHKNGETHEACLLMLCQNPDKPQIPSGLWIFDFLSTEDL